MKPPRFRYVRPGTLDEALAALASANGEGKVIAGGQSLMPMLNFRLLSPALLVDINRIAGLDHIEEHEGGLRIGALVRHHKLETSPLVARLFPVVTAAMAHVAHLAIRNRGTIGGSITHADPAAELPMMMVLLDARVTATSARGQRVIGATDFLVAALTSDVQEDEIVTEVTLPALPAGAGWAFEEVARRSGDFALAAASVILTVENDRASHVRIAVMGVADTALRLGAAEAALLGQACDKASLDAVVAAVRQAVTPETDLHASGDYRRHLVGVLVRRAITAAWQRAKGNQNA
ncbi:MAG: xanthine dehydrogenase family protein subunit [Paucimonas sp.]|nr:xanthine dehydrogenase family protein subunit [Paucimonas sp.]